MLHIKEVNPKMAKVTGNVGSVVSGATHAENARSSLHAWQAKAGMWLHKKGLVRKAREVKREIRAQRANGIGMERAITATNTTHTIGHPAKVLEKGLNNFDNDYYEAWGDDPYGGWYGDNGDDGNWEWQQGNGMNVMMMLERERERDGGGDIYNNHDNHRGQRQRFREVEEIDKDCRGV